jgi:hypothetical protein
VRKLLARTNKFSAGVLEIYAPLLESLAGLSKSLAGRRNL